MISKTKIHISYKDLQLDIEKILFAISDFFDINKNVPIIITRDWRDNIDEIYIELNRLLLDDQWVDKNISLNVEIKKDIDNVVVKRREQKLFEDMISKRVAVLAEKHPREEPITDIKKEFIVDIFLGLNAVKKLTHLTLRNYFLSKLTFPLFELIESIGFISDTSTDVKWLFQNVKHIRYFSSQDDSSNRIINFLEDKNEV